jgi:uncharacterized membrane protein
VWHDAPRSPGAAIAFTVGEGVRAVVGPAGIAQRVTAERLAGAAGLLVVLAFLVAGLRIGAATPPFQSPDEHGHVALAWAVGHGVLPWERPEGMGSGVATDRGLLGLMQAYDPVTRLRGPVTPEVAAAAEAIAWAGERAYYPNAFGIYLPVVYLPQAAGLRVGEALGWTVAESYRLGRLVTLLVACLFLLLALRIEPPSALALTVIALPMALFQIAAPVTDGLCAAIALVICGLLVRAIRAGPATRTRDLVALTACVIAVAGARPFLVVLVVPLLALSWWTRDRRGLVAGIVATLILAAWYLTAFAHNVDTRVADIVDPRANAAAYLADPGAFLEIVGRTLRDPGRVAFYEESFLGRIGWLDVVFTPTVYTWLRVLLVVALVASVLLVGDRRTWVARGLFVATAALAFVAILGSLAITWTPAGSPLIEGAQGRYLITPALLVAAAIAPIAAPPSPGRRIVAAVIAIVATLVSTHVALEGLAARYLPG